MKQRYAFLICILCLAGTAAAQKLDMNKLKGMRPRSIGPAGMSGRVTAIDVVRAQPTHIYVGSASGGVWKSENGGITWAAIFDSLHTTSIGALAIYQPNPNIIWVGTGEGNPRNSMNMGTGIYRSLDAGRSWQRMGLEKTLAIHRIIIHPTNPDVVYAGVIGSPWGEQTERGVYRTTDGGKSWEKILYVNERTGVADLVMDPTNPNKMFAAMWEHRRQPWFFSSGGAGSGLYVTHDGGKSWTKRTVADSLPAGELGRMGIAIARGNPNTVYAMVEAKKNALYRSDDGGYKWRRVNETNNINDRPFYYCELYVDPQNENRVYKVATFISRSEDGGRSFQNIIPYFTVHVDNHALYIHPDDPSYIIVGNDGGLAISHDKGQNWQFVDNLPLAQFYHINVDNAIPYKVYGGLQDNGSWMGPSWTWRTGGIRNTEWDNFIFADGFDVVPDPRNNRYGYGMAQQGYLARYDALTGDSKTLKPQHPQGLELRFNWNSGLAMDPFNPDVIYYGSQFVHKSSDRGENWEIISPDLTTNDKEKQKSNSSGGLTFDATGAENHCTILTLAPSTLQQGLLWAGTDDGNVQLTTDGGKNWRNLTPSLQAAGMPKAAWVPQIQASRYNANEALVVVNNYRVNNDWAPYLFHTSDQGKTWKRLTPPGSVQGYCLSVLQDVEVPNLLFLGTEHGLWVSLDMGANWTQWKHHYPSVPTMDMTLQTREHDLVIGTFGRAIYVLDDIRPLRTLAKEGMKAFDKTIRAYPAQDAYLMFNRAPQGYWTPGNSGFQGQNKGFGAIITFSVAEGRKHLTGTEPSKPVAGAKPASDTVWVAVVNAQGRMVRRFHAIAETGLNRVEWDKTLRGVRNPGSAKPRAGAPEPSGSPAMPGTYKIRLSYRGQQDSTTITLKVDPRVATPTAEVVAANERAFANMDSLQQTAVDIFDRVADAKRVVTLVGGQLTETVRDTALAGQVRRLATRMNDSLRTYTELFQAKEGTQGIIRNPAYVGARIESVRDYMPTLPEPLNSTYQLAYVKAKQTLQATLTRVNAFFGKDWKAYEQAVQAAQVGLMKAMPALQMKE